MGYLEMKRIADEIAAEDKRDVATIKACLVRDNYTKGQLKQMLEYAKSYQISNSKFRGNNNMIKAIEELLQEFKIEFNPQQQ